MEYRKATIDEYPQILNMYNLAIKAMEESGIYQWDDIYPSCEIINDINKNEMYIGVLNGATAAAFTLNCECDEQYVNGDWTYLGQRFLVLHRMCVNPTFHNKGIATQTGKYIEETMKNEGFEAMRLDAYSKNPAALRLYEKLGFTKVGETNFRRGRFYLFEKVFKLNEGGSV